MNYWIAIDKPQGHTSNAVVQTVKKILKATKVGHGGTLDPFATGILPIAVGEATKTSQFVLNHDKIYEFEVQFGVQTDTDDIEGNIIAQSNKILTEVQVYSALQHFIGEINQTPPKFSAKKINGVRAYKLARQGQEFLTTPCKVFIKNLSLLNFNPASQKALFYVEASKGTYIRALARDLGNMLGCFGHVTLLRRKKIGKFDEKLLISLENFEKIVHNGHLNDYIFSLDFVLVDIPAIEVTSIQAKKLKNGCSILIESEINNLVRLMHQDKLIALGNLNNKIFTITRIFND
jgi:tRNA pseudouridine55 synthase